MLSKRLVLILFCIPFYAFCQLDEDNKKVLNDVEKICKGKYENFHKAHEYFFNKETDSSFFYCSQASNGIVETSELTPYLNYFYGVNSSKKGFFSISREKLNRIPDTFKYKYLVDFNLANVELKDKNFKKALAYYKSALESGKTKSNFKLKRIYHNIGVCHFHLKNYIASEEFLLKEFQIIQKDKDTLDIIYNKIELGNLFYLQYKDDQAIPYFKEAYEFAKAYKDLNVKEFTSKNMAVVEKNRKHYKESVEYYEEYVKWKDSIWNRDGISKLLEKDKQIAVALKEKEVALQKEITQKQKERTTWFIGGFVLVLGFLGVLFYFYTKQKQQNKIILAQKEQLDILNATKDKLFSIVSHDLRSSVNTLKLSNKKLVSNLKAENITMVYQLLKQNSAIVGSAYNLLDNLLNWALLQTKQSYFEMKEIQLFFAMEQVAYNYIPLMEEKQLKFESTISKSKKVVADQESLKIVLRNLLDNAIKFSNKGGIIKVYIQHSKHGFLDIVIEDSGMGMNKKTLEKLQKETISISEKENNEIIGSGLGLQLCKSMIQKNKGVLSIDSELNNGTKMIVSLLKPLTNGKH